MWPEIKLSCSTVSYSENTAGLSIFFWTNLQISSSVFPLSAFLERQNTLLKATFNSETPHKARPFCFFSPHCFASPLFRSVLARKSAAFLGGGGRAPRRHYFLDLTKHFQPAREQTHNGERRCLSGIMVQKTAACWCQG